MLNQILLLFAGFFAVVGFITILYAIIEALSCNSKSNIPCEVVLFMKDCEEDAEGAIRQLAGQLSSGLSGIQIQSISAVDCNSTDQTAKILSKLSGDIDIVKDYTADQYIEHIKNFTLE